jgi:hypothetical protein
MGAALHGDRRAEMIWALFIVVLVVALFLLWVIYDG